MPAPYTGGCLCGELRYVVKSEPLTFYACHCTDCQRRTGTAFALSMVVSRGAFELQKGKPVFYKVQMTDGRTKTGNVCPACSTRVWGEPAKTPDVVIIQPGTLDDRSWLHPVAHIWTRSAQPWFQFPKDVARFEMQPAPGELAKLWQQRATASTKA